MIEGTPNLTTTSQLVFFIVITDLNILLNKCTIAVAVMATSMLKNKLKMGKSIVPRPNPEINVKIEATNEVIAIITSRFIYFFLLSFMGLLSGLSLLFLYWYSSNLLGSV